MALADSPIALAARDELPETWNALLEAPTFGDEALERRLNTLMYRTFGTVLDDTEQAVLSPVLISFMGKRFALDLIVPGIDFWSKQAISHSAGERESKAYKDRAEDLKALRLLLLEDSSGMLAEVEASLPLVPRRLGDFVKVQNAGLVEPHVTPDPSRIPRNLRAARGDDDGMSPFLSESLLGTEDILAVVESAIIRDINEALEVVYERREQLDQERAALRNEPYVPLEYEEIEPNHVYVGNFPSLALEEVGPEAYPYIAITVEDYTPEAEDVRQDHTSVYRSGFTVHCLAKSAPQGDLNDVGIDTASDYVFRRAVRMGEAVFLVLNQDPAASRLISGMSNPTRGQQSLPWTYQHNGIGPSFWFQAVGTTYVIKSYTNPYSP